VTINPARWPVVLGTWAALGVNLFSVVANVVTRQYAVAGASSFVVVLLLLGRWGFQQSEAWCRIKRREVEAHAAIAEGMLQKFHESDGVGFGLEIPIARPGGGGKH